MILDYNPATRMFVLRVNRREAVVQDIMREHGLDFSVPASTPQEAVLFTAEPYAAVAFHRHATPAARGMLSGLITEIEASWAPDYGGNFACPPDQELWGFQKASLAYALRRDNSIIGDQPGLGKTNTAICFANEVKAKRCLAIVPASLRGQWADRIRRWTTLPWPYTVHTIGNARHGVHPTAAWTVVSYELARTPTIAKALARGLYDVLVLDEAHFLKTPSSRRSRAVFGGGADHGIPALASRAGAILALTGTPLPNRPREAFVLARGLNHDCIDWMSEDAFYERFNPRLVTQVPDIATGRMKTFVDERSGRHAELQARLRANIMVRHLKREVMPQLKLPEYDIIQAEETGPVRQALEAESLLDIDPNDLAGADAAILGHISVVRKQMGLALAPQVADYVEMCLDGGEEKVVVFAWHIEVLDILQERLRKHGVVRVDGSTSMTTKDARVRQFQDDPRIRVILGNLLSLGTGTDGLQRVASRAVIAEPDWVPGTNIQAIDRLDRGGQTRQVQADIVVAPNSFAERILASALRKNHVIHGSLDRTF